MSVRRRALLRVQQALIAAQEIGDEKLQIVQQVQDLIENKSRQLDLDYRNLGEFINFTQYSDNIYRIFKKPRQDLIFLKKI